MSTMPMKDGAYDFGGLLSNPAFQMGLGILGNNNTENTAQVLGRGGLMGLQSYQQQKLRDDFNKVRQSQVDVMGRRQDREDKAFDMQQKAVEEASAKYPEQALLFQLDPQAAIRALYPQANGADPYYQFLPTADGYAAGNARTGTVDMVYGPNGQPLVRATDDPRLQGNIAGAKARETGRYSITDKIPGVVTTETNAASMINGGIPSNVPRLPQGEPQSNNWQIPPELQAQRDAKARELIASEAGQGGMGVTPPMPYNLPRGGGIRVPTKAEEAAQVKTAEKTAEIAATQQGDMNKAVKVSDKLLSAAQQAKDLLDTEPTGSLIGAGVDALGRGVGISSESAQNAAKLETLSGWMVANVPRMEGPQSNFDVENYKTMAGKIGNRTVPVSERKAALDQLIELQEKYKSLNQGTDSNGTPPKNKPPMKGQVVDGYKFKGGNPSDPNNWEEQ